MLARYTTDGKGRKKKVAVIYTKKEHGIDKNRIPSYAVNIIKTLRKHGYDSYIVGGAVRDLLQGGDPKDYDIATEATPGKIKKIFHNSRIIGRRFKLVHIYFNKTIVEVSTFRSNESDNFFNVYGTIEDDVHRRDFGINALYYCPEREWIVDYVNGVRDIKKGVVRSLIDLNETFKQDPVRIIRAVKYSNTGNFQLQRALVKAIVADAHLIAGVSSSRLVEELFKILATGKSYDILSSFIDYGVLEHFLPNIHLALHSSGDSVIMKKFLNSLKELDSSDPFFQVKKYFQLCMLVEPLIIEPHKKMGSEELFKNYFKQIKLLIRPLTPPNADVEKAVIRILKNQGVNVRKRGRSYSGRNRRSKDNK